MRQYDPGKCKRQPGKSESLMLAHAIDKKEAERQKRHRPHLSYGVSHEMIDYQKVGQRDVDQGRCRGAHTITKAGAPCVGKERSQDSRQYDSQAKRTRFEKNSPVKRRNLADSPRYVVGQRIL